MKILIDTQVLVWLLNLDKRLGTLASGYLRNQKNRVLVSYFSLFEIVIKSSIGKMTYDDSLVDDLPGMDIELVSPSREHLQEYRVFNPDNKNPFDNILLAVTLSEKSDFMTSDDRILTTAVKGLNLIDAKK